MLLIVVLTDLPQEKCLPVCETCGRTTYTTDIFFPRKHVMKSQESET